MGDLICFGIISLKIAKLRGLYLKYMYDLQWLNPPPPSEDRGQNII